MRSRPERAGRLSPRFRGSRPRPPRTRICPWADSNSHRSDSTGRRRLLWSRVGYTRKVRTCEKATVLSWGWHTTGRKEVRVSVRCRAWIGLCVAGWLAAGLQLSMTFAWGGPGAEHQCYVKSAPSRCRTHRIPIEGIRWGRASAWSTRDPEMRSRPERAGRLSPRFRGQQTKAASMPILVVPSRVETCEGGDRQDQDERYRSLQYPVQYSYSQESLARCQSGQV